MDNVFITEKLQDIFNSATNSLSNRKIIFPIDIFIAMIMNNSGSLKDINTKFYNNLKELQDIALNIGNSNISDNYTFLNYKISDSTLKIINTALKIMHINDEIYLNELIFLKSLALNNNEVTKYLNEKDLNFLLKFPTDSKDLIVNLSANISSNISLEKPFVIRKALSNDKYILYEFIKENFNTVWADTLLPSFSSNNIPIFIAFFNKSIIGFTAYDIFGDGTFGPIGVLKEFRNNCIGKALLLSTLSEMKAQGYLTVIIKNAGPIEFYEKSCNAHII